MSNKRIFYTGLLIAVCFSSCHIGRFFIYNFADINDYKKFPATTLHRSETPFHFKQGTAVSKLHLPDSIHYKKKKYPLGEGLRKNGTVAFLIIRNDSVVYEWYDKGYSADCIVPSFSMAKSFVSILVGIAIDEGAIKSTSEPITNYLDYLDQKKFGKITIQHLLDMRSGIKYNEGYFNPFSDVAKYYYGRNIKKYTHHMKVKKEPGKEFDYISLNTQLLGLILEKATGKALTAYMQEKLWTPLGMEHDASWSMDSKRHHTEKAFCGLNGRPKDFAKFGRLYLNKGTWQGKQIVSEKWVRTSVEFTEPKNDFEYSNQWWHTLQWQKVEDSTHVPSLHAFFNGRANGKPQRFVIYPYPDFYADGFLGQLVYVHPEKKIICVRLGRKYGWMNWPFFFREIAEAN